MTSLTGWTAIRHRTGRGLIAALSVMALALATASAADAAAAIFKTPEEAVKAFAAAVNSEQGQGLIELFGPEHKDDLIGGDPAEARQGVQTLRRTVAEGITIADDGEGRKELVIGRNGWPMPIPLVEVPGGWSFDVDAGIEEINDRRIGRNELAVIEACRAYLEAQAAYASVDRDGDQVLEFAQKLMSTPGQRDGLFWDASAGGDASPLGPFFASSEQYLDFRREGEPFHGYYFRILPAQGGNPPGGAYSYVINGNMIVGHALLAWPADYGRSGIMSFLCSHLGTIVEKDLGEDTRAVAEAMGTYDPDDTWTPAE